VHGCTDVTGFGLAGHACEMATASDVLVELELESVPLLAGARDLALGNRTGGMVNNRKHFGAAVEEGPLPADLLALAFDPQTSGGLLASIDASAVDAVLASMASHGVEAVIVGKVAPSSTTCRVRLR
jgi:selenide,water dikinase